MPPFEPLTAWSVGGATLLGITSVYHAATLAAALRWRRDSRETERASTEEFTKWPGVTILKPVRGIDPGHETSFRSFCQQDYPDYEVIFGALDPIDPGLEAAQRLQNAVPESRVKVVAGGEIRGANRKVSTLLAMMPHADPGNEVLVIADSDMRVTPDYLLRVIAPFAQPETGLVTCPYRGAEPASLGGVLEALGIGTDFIPSSFLAYYAFGVRFAFGSTIAIRRSVLEAIGGFEGLVDLLADDYALAERTSRAGHQVVLSSYVVDDILGRESFVSVWLRRLRWARTARALRPGPYYGLFVTYLTPIALFAAASTGFSVAGWTALVAALAYRMTIAASIARLTGDRSVARWLLLLPVSEMVSAALWVTSLCSRTIHWRGERFVVQRDGTLARDDT